MAHRPLPGTAVRLAGGLLAEWQARNGRVSLPAAVEHLRTAGNLENLRLAAAGANTGYRGPAFMDSDIYKTLEAVGWELGRTADEALAAFAGEAVTLLERAQLADGYLNSFIQVSGQPRYAHLERSHELYCAGHLIQAGIAHARATGATRLLGVAQRFADQLAGTFLGPSGGLDGHPVIESALVELYRQLGDPRYLRLALQFIDRRGHGLVGDYYGFGRRYLQDHLPVRDAATIAGHAVRALYLDAGVADVAAETGDAGLLASSITRWDDMVATKTAITGGNGSRHDGEAFGDAYELPPDRAYNETCAAVASFQWSWRLLLATGQSKYADLIERLLYNGLAAAVS
ncbi:MAG: glycoside hydrolase family 127 protein, partial [Kitasatospora sp.]|nr:glycoside hydrolase family 127 protein [Kitasatospora sp.]